MFISSISEVTGDAVTWHGAEEAGKTGKNIAYKDNITENIKKFIPKTLFIWKVRTTHCEMSKVLLTSSLLTVNCCFSF